MTQDVHRALAAQFERHEIRAQLHDVPPHAVYEVRVDGRRAVCKVARGPTAEPATEAAVVDHLARRTDLPVPTVLASGEGYFVASWLDGLPAADESPDPGEVDDGYARALGAGLGRLHEATAGTFARPGFPRPAGGTRSEPEGNERGLRVDGRGRWPEVLRAYLDRVADDLADTEWVEPVREVRRLVADRPDLFAGGGAPVLCHGNFLPAHVGFATDPAGEPADPAGRAAELAAVVDFEHALVAPGEYDYWRTATPVFRRPDGPPRPTLSAFRAGYESVRPLPDGFDRRSDGYALVNLASYLRALRVQNDGIGPDERPRAEGMAAAVEETVAAVRERRP
ncbi:phosphotransferase [Halosimplex marinum]|uniref:phosphotransferase n=1 Tax=Halosimplex marinum TaxID=3396620 RepID=UPI003F57D659